MTLNKRDHEGLTESHPQNFQYVDQAESETGFSGADPALIIKGGLIQNVSCQILGNNSKGASFF